MMNLTCLNSTKTYLIKGESGIWHFSHEIEGFKEKKYNFWRDAVNNPRRKVTINLSRIQVQKKVHLIEERM